MVPSDKTLISFICTCNGVILNQWGTRLSMEKKAEDQLRLFFHLPSPLGVVWGLLLSTTYTGSVMLYQESSTGSKISSHLLQTVSVCPCWCSTSTGTTPLPWPHGLTPPTPALHRHHPHQDYGKWALASFCSKFRLTLQVLQGFEMPAIFVEL